MITEARSPVVMDVTTKWAVDAALFLAVSAGFLLWGVIARSATANILTFAIMATVALLLDRLRPFLPDAAGLRDRHDRPPADAVRRTWVRYAGEAAAVMVAAFVIEALVIVVLLGVQQGFVAGWMTAFFVSRLRGLATARDIERASGVRLSVLLQRSVWRKRAPAFYSAPRPA
jgi:hypothetical protein